MSDAVYISYVLPTWRSNEQQNQTIGLFIERPITEHEAVTGVEMTYHISVTTCER